MLAAFSLIKMLIREEKYNITFFIGTLFTQSESDE